MSLLELIERADERALAASAVACLDRCLPLLAGPDGPEPLRPLWASCEDGREWAIRLAAVRTAMDDEAVSDGPAARVRAMLGAAPSDFDPAPLREWADACSLVALEIHGRFDAPDGEAPRGRGRPAEGGARRRGGRRGAAGGRGTGAAGPDPGDPRGDRRHGGQRGRGAQGPGPVRRGAPGAARGDVTPGPHPGVTAEAAFSAFRGGRAPERRRREGRPGSADRGVPIVGTASPLNSSECCAWLFSQGRSGARCPSGSPRIQGNSGGKSWGVRFSSPGEIGE